MVIFIANSQTIHPYAEKSKVSPRRPSVGRRGTFRPIVGRRGIFRPTVGQKGFFGQQLAKESLFGHQEAEKWSSANTCSIILENSYQLGFFSILI